MAEKSNVSLDACSFWTLTAKSGDVSWHGFFADFKNAQVAEWLIESADGSGKVLIDEFRWPGRYQEAARRIATKGMVRVGLYLDELIRMDRNYEDDRTQPIRSMFVREDKAGRVSYAVGGITSALDTFEADIFGGRDG